MRALIRRSIACKHVPPPVRMRMMSRPASRTMYTGAPSSEEAMKLERQYSCHNYHPLPAVLSKGSGAMVWDPEGKRYYDFLAAYGAVNQGHCHPKIVKALTDQLSVLTLSSRAFYNDMFGNMCKYVTSLFGYEALLPMNTGAEAVESAVKLARKWAYTKKGVPEGEALIVTMSRNFHGRTISIVSFSTDKTARDGFGPFTPGFLTVPFDDLEALEACLQQHGKKVAGILVEPIQGEAGIIVPQDGYLSKVHDLARKHDALLIADEIQSGIGRAGKLLAQEWDGARADITILGKAVTGGVYPASYVLSDWDVMECIHEGEHGSTYGGNPLAAVATQAALEALHEDQLIENSLKQGETFRDHLATIDSAYIAAIRGRGLMNAIDVRHDMPLTAFDICILLRERGLLCKPTHDITIRLTPPLCIDEHSIIDAASIIKDTLMDASRMCPADVPEDPTYRLQNA